MAQRPKLHVRAALLAAAAEALATHGAADATLVDIAAAAGTSIGNLYKYFESKQALFGASIPPALVATLERLVRERVVALGLETDTRALPSTHGYRQASAALDAFSTEHRHALRFLLRDATGTAYEGFAERLERLLCRLAVQYARGAYPGFRATPARRRSLARMYRGFIASLASMLDEERQLGDALDHLTTFHLAGLKAFFAANA
jgi:AcrR family transcriptional regulator